MRGEGRVREDNDNNHTKSARVVSHKPANYSMCHETDLTRRTLYYVIILVQNSLWGRKHTSSISVFALKILSE